MYKICFVCLGATCRSPMAANLFNFLLRERGLTGASATYCGLSANLGDSINPCTVSALHKRGIKRCVGKSKPISGEILSKNNLIICMTRDYFEALRVMSAQKFVSKIFSFVDFGGTDILDPYGKGQQVYTQCAKQIEDNLLLVINELARQKIIKPKGEKCSKK